MARGDRRCGARGGRRRGGLSPRRASPEGATPSARRLTRCDCSARCVRCLRGGAGMRCGGGCSAAGRRGGAAGRQCGGCGAVLWGAGWPTRCEVLLHVSLQVLGHCVAPVPRSRQGLAQPSVQIVTHGRSPGGSRVTIHMQPPDGSDPAENPLALVAAVTLPQYSAPAQPPPTAGAHPPLRLGHHPADPPRAARRAAGHPEQLGPHRPYGHPEALGHTAVATRAPQPASPLRVLRDWAVRTPPGTRTHRAARVAQTARPSRS